MTAHLTQITSLARKVVESIHFDEGPNGGLLSPQTLLANEQLDKLVRKLAFSEPMQANTPYKVVFDGEVPPGTLAVFKIESDGRMVEVGRLVDAVG